MSAGIWVTRPSPTDSVVNAVAASAGDMPWRVTPMTMPPKTLTAVMMMPAIASPRTNLEAPSMAPKKALSSSSSRRRRVASLSSMRPALRSASMAICLPGMASSVKRAPTSAMRVAPLVMTTKLTVMRITNTIVPMTKSPLITKLAKPAMTWPAAAGPSLPFERISRVVAMLSASRSRVAISRTVGNAEKSSGRWIHNATIRMSTASAMDSDRPMSITTPGSGRNSTVRMKTMPTAKPTSLAPSRSTAFTLAAAGAAIPSLARSRPEDRPRTLREGAQMLSPTPSEAHLDAGVHGLREGIDDRSDEWSCERGDEQDCNNLGDERQRHLLHLRQRLEQGNDDAYGHGCRDCGAGRNDHGPQGGLDNVERVGLVHVTSP